MPWLLLLFLLTWCLCSAHGVRLGQVWALGNIAGDSPVCRDLVLQQGAMGPLLQQLTDRSKLSMLRNATWTLSNFCRGKPQPSFEHVRPALPTLAQLIHSVDEEVRTCFFFAVIYMCIVSALCGCVDLLFFGLVLCVFVYSIVNATLDINIRTDWSYILMSTRF